LNKVPGKVNAMLEIAAEVAERRRTKSSEKAKAVNGSKD
jgi:hypothetical protein